MKNNELRYVDYCKPDVRENIPDPLTHVMDI